MTNNFYDKAETYQLPIKELIIEGEIENRGKIYFSTLQKRSVVVKETHLSSTGGDRFTGAFRYDGYSLFDILEKSTIKKTNAEEFNNVIDLYVEIENDKGQKVLFSWGEIYYPNNLHRIIIANSVSRIVPSKTKELWELPQSSRIVVANDLFTERYISNPVRITVKSFRKSFKIEKGMSPMYSDKILIFRNDEHAGQITEIPQTLKETTFNTIFYGRGKGIHSTSPFTGVLLKEILSKYYPVDRETIIHGLICVAGLDGYRCVISYSELFNRNDQQEFLLISSLPGKDGGVFRMFAACDFFSDRAVKSINEINLSINQ
jgi:hypothetical protein